MSEAKENVPQPKSMRHKRILDAAADDPGASIDDIARMVPSATPDLVERVLEEYGDPAADSSAEKSTEDGSAPSDEESTVTTSSAPSNGGTQSDGSPGTGVDETTAAEGETMDIENESTDGGVDIDEPLTGATPTEGGADVAGQAADPAYLTPAERETLRAIQANPEATQRVLAEELGVSAATVSQRVNGIEGFEWSDRASFVASLFDTEQGDTISSPSQMSSDPTPEMPDEPAVETADESGSETANDSTTVEDDEPGTKTTDDSRMATADSASPDIADEPDSGIADESSTETTDKSGPGTTDDSVTETAEGSDPVTPDESVAEGLHELGAQVEALVEQQTTRSVFDDPELVAKIVRACLDAETISEDEELEIIQTLMT